MSPPINQIQRVVEVDNVEQLERQEDEITATLNRLSTMSARNKTKFIFGGWCQIMLSVAFPNGYAPAVFHRAFVVVGSTRALRRLALPTNLATLLRMRRTVSVATRARRL